MNALLDINLEERSFQLMLHPSFFKPGFKDRWQSGFVTNRYKNKIFHVGEKLGLSERLIKTSAEPDRIIYEWKFPELEKVDCLCVGFEKDECSYCKNSKFLMRAGQTEFIDLYRTVNVLSNYELMPQLSEKDWEGQSFALYETMACHGLAYKPLLSFLANSSSQVLSELEAYIKTEMIRIYSYVNGYKPYSTQVTVNNRGFFIALDPGKGIWLSLNSSHLASSKKEYFSYHNADHEVDQFFLFSALVALNTFYRRTAAK